MPSKARGTKAKKVIKQNGKDAMKNARESIIQILNDNSRTFQALSFFSNIALQKALPVFPALITMSCRAVKGDTEKVVPFGEAIVLISAAADLHDDVIDQSLTKGSHETVLGRFGAPTAILSGDILLAKGFEKLNAAVKTLPVEQSSKIFSLVTNAIFEICSAEAIEIDMHNKLDCTVEEYSEVIKRKAVVPELAMRLGGIIGQGKPSEVDALGQFGRTYGVVSIIIEDLADLLNIDEMKNRLRNECPPLPLIYALQNPILRTELTPLMSHTLSQEAHEKIVENVLNSKEMQILQQYLVKEVNQGITNLPAIVNGKIREELTNLLLAPLDCFEDS